MNIIILIVLLIVVCIVVARGFMWMGKKIFKD
jgi:flagellar basal body-associated protein FliL